MQLDMGDVPAWLQVAGGTAQLAQAMWAQHATRAQHLRDEIQAETGYSLDDLAQRVAENPALGALLLNALEAATRSASAQKRRVLARVVAAAFTSDDLHIDELTILQRTAGLVEDLDAAVLILIAKSKGAPAYAHSAPGCVLLSDILDAIPEDVDDAMLTPVLTHLVGLGLLLDLAAETYDHVPKWSVSPYGYRFLRFLPVDRRLFDSADLITSWSHITLTVSNVGWGDLVVHRVSATCDGRLVAGNYPEQNVRLPAGKHLSISVDDEVPQNGGLKVRVEWTDPLGNRSTHEVIHWKH